MNTPSNHSRSGSELTAIRHLHKRADLVQNSSILVARIVNTVLEGAKYEACAKLLRNELEKATQCDDLDKLRSIVGEVTRRNAPPEELAKINKRKWFEAPRGHEVTEKNQQKMVEGRGDHHWPGEEIAELFWIVHDANFQHQSGMQKGFPDYEIIAAYFRDILELDELDATTIKAQWSNIRLKIYKAQGMQLPRKKIDWEGRGFNRILLECAKDNRFQHQRKPHKGLPNYKLIVNELGDNNITVAMCRAQMYALLRRKSRD